MASATISARVVPRWRAALYAVALRLRLSPFLALWLLAGCSLEVGAGPRRVRKPIRLDVRVEMS